MKNKINYDVQGSLKGKKKGRVQREFAKDLHPTFVGYKIDEFQINATITSQKEFDDFMWWLDEIRPCMYSNG